MEERRQIDGAFRLVPIPSEDEMADFPGDAPDERIGDGISGSETAERRGDEIAGNEVGKHDGHDDMHTDEGCP